MESLFGENSRGPCGQSEINLPVLIPVCGPLNRVPPPTPRPTQGHFCNLGMRCPLCRLFMGLGRTSLHWAALLCVGLCSHSPTVRGPGAHAPFATYTPKATVSPGVRFRKNRWSSGCGTRDLAGLPREDTLWGSRAVMGWVLEDPRKSLDPLVPEFPDLWGCSPRSLIPNTVPFLAAGR